MLANIWHWWIGVVLTFVAVAAVLGLVGGYLKSVTSQQYPNRRQRRED
jgi:formate-dependent nitrite reductase membrane component NrfD